MALLHHHDDAPSGLFGRATSFRHPRRSLRRSPASAPGVSGGACTPIGSVSGVGAPNRHELMRRALDTTTDAWSDSHSSDSDDFNQAQGVVRSTTAPHASALHALSRPPSEGSLRLDDVVRAASTQTTVTAPPLARPAPRLHAGAGHAGVRRGSTTGRHASAAGAPSSPLRPLSSSSPPALIRSASPAKPAQALVSQASASGHTPLRAHSPAAGSRSSSPLAPNATPARSRRPSQLAPSLAGGSAWNKGGGDDEISASLRNALSTALDTTRLSAAASAQAQEPPSRRAQDDDESDTSSGPSVSSGAAWDTHRASSLEQQITGFAVASSKRNADFHGIFADAPEDDYLIEDYGCALVRDILHQGRLYVSENHLCFNSSLFGWVNNLVVPFADIVSIEKRNTALVIPNAITVATLTAKYTFASFLSREATYDVIVNIWKLSHPSLDNRYADRVTHDDTGPGQATAEARSKARLSKRARLRRRFMERRERRRDAGMESDDEEDDDDDDDGDTSESSDEDREQEGVASEPKKRRCVRRPTECDDGRRNEHYPNVVLDATYPTSVETLHNLLYTTDFVRTFLVEEQKVLDVEMGEWEPPESGGSSPAGKHRLVSYIKPLNGSIGPKQAKCVIEEASLHNDPEKYTTTITTTRTPDVPSGGSFAVKTRTCLTWAGGWRTRLLVTCTVEWTGRSFIRSIIDRASIDGQKEYYAALNAAIERYIHEHPTEFKDTDGDGDVDEEVGGDEDGEDEADQGVAEAPSPWESRRTSTMGRGQAASTASVWWDWLGPARDAGADLVAFVRDAAGQASVSTVVLGSAVVVLLILNVWAMSSSSSVPSSSSRGLGSSSTWAERTRADEAILGKAMRQALHDALLPHQSDGGSHALSDISPRSEIQRLLVLLERQEKQVESLRADLARVFHQVAEQPDTPIL